jgi:hypothetical protein
MRHYFHFGLMEICVFIGLVKSIRYPINQPIYCAVIWGFMRFFIGLRDQSFTYNVLATAIAFALSLWFFTKIKWLVPYTKEWLLFTIPCGLALVFFI